ncbi:MAG: class I tRNA ligase family protein, partial [Armatimonadetes bacterium]|nr:class I tRNA ligase family protein [Armatimonadota bacterium]
VVPFVTEAIYQNLVRSVESDAPESVHLCDFPEPQAAWRDPGLEALMGGVRDLVSLGRAARATARIRVRQPLPGALIVTMHRGLRDQRELTDLLADELNVKAVRFIDDASRYVSFQVKPRFDRLGPKYGARVQPIAAALRGLDPSQVVAAASRGQAVTVQVAGEPIQIEPDELDVRLQEARGYAASGMGGNLVILETAIDDRLALEGRARELVHHIQQMRKDQGLEVSDRIVLYLDGDVGLEDLLAAHREYVLAETLGTDIRPGAAAKPGARELRLDGLVAHLAVERLPQA